MKMAMKYVDLFISHIQKEKRYSLHTVDAYRHDLLDFSAFIQTQYTTDEPASVKTPYVKSWIYSLSAAGNKERSINRKLVSLKSFFKFLITNGYADKNPLTAIKSLKTEKKITNFINEKPLEFLFNEYIWGADFAGLRDKLLIELLYATGIRRSELIGLKTSDVHAQEGIIKVLGKRNKERIIPYPNSTKELILQYTEALKEKGWNGSEFFLLTDKGLPLNISFVYQKVKKVLAFASTQKKLSPHVLRHSFATHLLNNGADINAIKELLGHTSLAATQVYTHNSIEDLKKIYKQAHPKS